MSSKWPSETTDRRVASNAGKTTYLTTIGLLIIQAMIGSFVPAEYASVALNDALLSRLSNDDDSSRLEHSCLRTKAKQLH